MPMNEADGNMYPWVTNTHCHHRGRCGYGCTYCYTQHMRSKRFYQGPMRLVDKELKESYGSGKTIFIDHMIDLFADSIPAENIKRVLAHCRQYPDNTYVFQTRNPTRAYAFYLMTDEQDESLFPEDFIVGTTIETNRRDLTRHYSKAPDPEARAWGMSWLDAPKQTFVTIEPIMDFDLTYFVGLLRQTQKDFINIGADSKHQNLPEPSKAKTLQLIDALRECGYDVRLKANLGRIIGESKLKELST